METITYKRITAENFFPTSLDGFVFRQEVRECWRRTEGRWKLLPVAYTDDSGPDAQTVLDALRDGAPAFGAWLEGTLVGLALLAKERFGSAGQYVDLAEFYVSLPWRRRGIGEKLFTLACQGARELGAEKLYISAHSARESIAAYRKYGCVEAEEVNQFLAEKEPCDVQMEFRL
ncbi:MAG: GNAT family N-acetyltransferase [Oscillospiraceae bacterium]|nr:GNAT family N-acetyltransferase [Oscillospiraceae bacterium]